MILGFTGTERGMTQRQRDTVRYLFGELGLHVLHHGDCIGADAEAHRLARAVSAHIVVHPPSDESNRAFMDDAHETRPAYAFLTRNRHIVRDSRDGVIAAPHRADEPRSTRGDGTWTTVRYARQAKRRIWIVAPDGTFREEQP